MNIHSFWNTVKILFIILNIAIGVISVFSTYVWSRFNPSVHNPENYPILLVSRLILNGMRIWSAAMFFFMLIVTAYWFIFYKMQNDLYFLAPDPKISPGDFKAFIIVFSLTVAFRLITVLNMIREQVQMDFFFIDWVGFFLIFLPIINIYTRLST